MSAPTATLAIAAAAYLLGRALFPWFAPRGSQAIRHRLQGELLVGNAIVALVGLGLAEVGLFSLPMAAGLASAGGVAAAGLRRLRPGLCGRAPYNASDAAAALAAIAGFAALWPAMDTTLFAADSSAYIATGIRIAETHSIEAHDPTVLALSPEDRAIFFPPYNRLPGPVPFLRTPGGLLLPSMDRDVVISAFHHLLSVWVALFFSLGSAEAGFAVAPYFGALSLTAIASFTHALGGLRTAAIVFPLLISIVPQYWYSRFLMPEIPSQYFLWGGLMFSSIAPAAPHNRLALLGGLSVGMAGLMRFDLIPHLAGVLALWVAIRGSRSWPGGWGFPIGFAAVSVYAIAHQIRFPTHYWTEIILHLNSLREFVTAQPGLLAPWATAGGVAAVLLLIAVRRRTDTGKLLGVLMPRLVGAAIFAVYVIGAFATTRPDFATPAGWLRMYLGWPLLLLTAGGLIAWRRAAKEGAQSFALLCVAVVAFQLLYDPRVTPAALWGVRRFLPIAIPGAAVAAALALDGLWRRGWRVSVLLLALAALAHLGPRLAGAHWQPAYRGAMRHARTLAAILPADAVVIGEPGFFRESQLHTALWGLRGIPVYLFRADMADDLRRIRRALPGRPLYFISPTDRIGRPAAPLQPVASYRFTIGRRRMEWYEDRDDFAFNEVTLGVYRIPNAKKEGAGSARSLDS